MLLSSNHPTVVCEWRFTSEDAATSVDIASEEESEEEEEESDKDDVADY